MWRFWLTRIFSSAELPWLYGDGPKTLHRLCWSWQCKTFPQAFFTDAWGSSASHGLSSTVAFRKFVGYAMDLVSATEMIDAPTAVAEEGTSKSGWHCWALQLIPFLNPTDSYFNIPLLQLQPLSRTWIEAVYLVSRKTTTPGLHQPHSEMVGIPLQ